MLNLALAAVFFLAIHLIVSGTPLRDRITGALGENAYLGLFSLASIGGIAWLCMAYNAAYADANSFYWTAPTWATHLGSLVMLIAFLFAVIGMTTPNPTAVKAEEVLDRPHGVEGMLRVTRHPFLVGVALWSLFHFIVNGDAASLIFFGTFLVLSVLGPYSIDAKRRRKLGDKWQSFARQTSVIPFGAIVAGRNKFAVREFALWRILLAIGLWAVILYAHQWLFGVSPIPGTSFY